jgi:hypothetical protein
VVIFFHILPHSNIIVSIFSLDYEKHLFKRNVQRKKVNFLYFDPLSSLKNCRMLIFLPWRHDGGRYIFFQLEAFSDSFSRFVPSLHFQAEL